MLGTSKFIACDRHVDLFEGYILGGVATGGWGLLPPFDPQVTSYLRLFRIFFLKRLLFLLLDLNKVGYFTLIGRAAKGGSQELDFGGDERCRNIVHSEQEYETAHSFLLTVTRL